ncbi:MAG: hypothetical protein BWY52_03295 [Chloroflexi bacterium ADurb.Bin325]|nr:MAG: hypothetical protein BWY52_03295 [Chloroflexi bacterium ADurb.Bin325]
MVGVERDERRQVFALEAQRAVGVIFDEGDAVFVGQPHKVEAPLQRQGRAARILEVGQDIDELGPDAQRALQQLRAQPVVVLRHRDIVGLVGVPRLQRAQIGRLLYQHPVAGVDQHLADQIQRLLSAAGDQHVARLGPDAVAGHAVADEAAQGRVALGRPVLQGGRAVRVQQATGRGLALGQGEQLRRGQAAGKRDDIGLLGELQQLADDRTSHALRALRITALPGCAHAQPPR